MKSEKKSKLLCIFSSCKEKGEKPDKSNRKDKKHKTDKSGKADKKSKSKDPKGEAEQLPEVVRHLGPFQAYLPNALGKYPLDYVPVNISALNLSSIQSTILAKSSLPSKFILSKSANSTLSKDSTLSKTASNFEPSSALAEQPGSETLPEFSKLQLEAHKPYIQVSSFFVFVKSMFYTKSNKIE